MECWEVEKSMMGCYLVTTDGRSAFTKTKKRICCFPFDLLMVAAFSIVEVQVVKDCIADGLGSLSAYLLIEVNCCKRIKLFVCVCE
ncbi:hypothetical protein CEXT_785781 [Caerostris extrusa]|uniref:Uncharacterized protein n=1 Tax=Caerostris extrusa TaxID=172846 RepID=A0AAV4MAG1_CAEEX|nr:hypothetical protein CEXT_785781 [Caerostris extrusa]